MEKFAGVVVDRNGAEIEVWLDEETGHVVLYELDAQVGSFWPGQPCGGDPRQVTAERVARGESKRLAVFADDDDFTVIEPFGEHKTLRTWPGDGKVH